MGALQKHWETTTGTAGTESSVAITDLDDPVAVECHGIIKDYLHKAERLRQGSTPVSSPRTEAPPAMSATIAKDALGMFQDIDEATFALRLQFTISLHTCNSNSVQPYPNSKS